MKIIIKNKNIYNKKNVNINNKLYLFNFFEII